MICILVLKSRVIEGDRAPEPRWSHLGTRTPGIIYGFVHVGSQYTIISGHPQNYLSQILFNILPNSGLKNIVCS